MKAKSREGNILAFAVDAARERANLGEISSAMESVFGRHKAVTRMISSVYNNLYKGDVEYELIQGKISEFKNGFNRLPHILVAKMGQDGHDRGAKKSCVTAFAGMGFKVDVTRVCP